MNFYVNKISFSPVFQISLYFFVCSEGAKEQNSQRVSYSMLVHVFSYPAESYPPCSKEITFTTKRPRPNKYLEHSFSKTPLRIWNEISPSPSSQVSTGVQASTATIIINNIIHFQSVSHLFFLILVK